MILNKYKGNIDYNIFFITGRIYFDLKKRLVSLTVVHVFSIFQCQGSKIKVCTNCSDCELAVDWSILERTE